MWFIDTNLSIGALKSEMKEKFDFIFLPSMLQFHRGGDAGFHARWFAEFLQNANGLYQFSYFI